MDEFSFIDNIKPNTYRQNKLIKGIGDDAAIFRMGNEDTVIAVDTFVEGVHFTKETMEPWQIGYRLMAANLSDLAAMGAAPLFYLASVVIPDELPDADVLQIFSGMKKLADVYGVDLIGGDTTSGGLLTLSLTIIGSVPVGKARLRSDARPGDVVFVTGTLGDAGAGLDLLLNNIPVNCPEAEKRKLIKRHQLPTPRVEFALKLREIGRVALNDISDGLANELNEIAASSNVLIEIDDALVPVSKALSHFPKDRLDYYKYFAGEDFELVGTVAKSDFPKVEEIAAEAGVRVTEIGFVSYNKERNGKVLLRKNGVLKTLRKKGYVHRKSREKS